MEKNCDEAIGVTNVATGEVTTLEHELRDDAVEGRALVAKTLLTGAESTEVLGGLGHDAVVELEVDAAGLDCTAIMMLAVFQSGSSG